MLLRRVAAHAAHRQPWCVRSFSSSRLARIGAEEMPKSDRNAAAAASRNPFSRLWTFYLRLLEDWPITTKSVTSGVMYGLGDVLAQVVDPSRPKGAPLDWHRAGIFTLYGTIIAGPLYHFWYGNLNQLPFAMMKARKLRQQVKFRRLQQSARELGIQLPKDIILSKPKEFSKTTYVITKVLADQLVFSPVYLLVFFYGTGTLMGKSLEECTTHTKDVYLTSYIADSVLWPLAQVINFSFVPAPLQPIYVNVLNVFWNAFLSFMANKSH